MFAYQDDEGTVNIFSPRLIEAAMPGAGQNCTVGLKMMWFCTGAPNIETAVVLAKGLIENFKHEGDLQFQVLAGTGNDPAYVVQVSKKS